MKLITAIVAAILTTTVLTATPAQASRSYVFDCATEPPGSGLDMSETEGDTFTFDAPNCQVAGYDANYVNTSMISGPFTTPPNMWIGPQTFTAVSTTFLFIQVFEPSSPSIRFTIRLLVRTPAPTPTPTPTPTPAPAPAPAQPEPAIEPIPLNPGPLGQGLPVPQTGDCRDINEQDATWGINIKGGWVISWKTWRLEDGTIYHDGWACTRTIEWINGQWQVRQPDENERFIKP